MQHKSNVGFAQKANLGFAFLIFVVLVSLVGSRPVSAAPAGTALQFNGTNQYVTFGSTTGVKGTLTNAPVWQTLPANIKFGASSLLFNGTNQYVTFGAAPELNAQTFTIETWFMKTGAGATTTTGTGGLAAAIPLITKGRGEAENSNVDMNYFLGINSTGVLAADFEECSRVQIGCPATTTNATQGGQNFPVTGSTVIQNNVWYHAAATFDGRYWKLYLNGVLETMSAGADTGANRLPRWDSIQHAGIGTAMTSTGVAAGYFQGYVDEVRIWNVARSQAEIQASMNSEILTPTNGLLGRWGLNDGAGTTASNLNRLGVTTFTLEAWVKRAAGGVTMSTGALGFDGGGGRPNGIYPVLVKGMGEGETPTNINTNWFLGITIDGFVGADFEDTAGGVNHPAWGTTNVPIGEWHHIAATYTGSCWALYVDGNPDTLNAGATGCPNVTPEASSYQYASLAASQSSTGTLGAGYFSGVIDEARVWNRALTPAEILANKYLELTSGTGLIARWGLNEGTGTVINDSAVPTAENGTAVNGPTWVTGFPDNISPAAPTGLTASSYSRNINLTWTANSESDFAGYNLYRSTTAGGPYTKLNAALLTSTTYLDAGLTNGTTYYYVLRAVDSSNNESTNSSEVNATPSLAQGAALQFNGSNQYVTFGVGNSLASPLYTIETWFKRTGAGVGVTTGGGGIPSAIPLITKGTSENEAPAVDINYFLGIDATSGVLVADFEEGAGGAAPSQNHPVSGTTVIANNTWYHAAMTYDGTTLRIYLNGVLENSLTVGQPTASATTSPTAFGTSIRSNGTTIQGYFAGVLDEPRIWNRALTYTEIQTNINSQLTSGSGLIARWGMNEGAGATIASSIGTFNGMLTNGPLWVPGAPFNIVFGIPAAPIALNTNATSGTNINLTWNDNSNNEVAFEIERGDNLTGLFSALTSVGANITTYADSALTPFTQYCYRVRAINAGGQSAYSNVSCSTTPAEGGEALQLGNANAYVVFPNSASLNTPTYTIETWFRRDGAGVADTTGTNGVNLVPILSKGTHEDEVAAHDINYIMGISPTLGNVLCADFEEAATGAAPSQNHPVCGTTSIANGVWYHAAATYDGTTWNLYLNGMLEATLVVGQPANTVNISPVALGTGIQSDGTSTFGHFDGTLEEARIWNTAHSQAQILATINSQITTAQPNLIARWGLNQNTGTAINGSAGTTVNGTITGAGYSWVTPGAPFNINFSIPVAPTGLNASASFAYQVDLTWTDNSNNEVKFEVERGDNSGGPFSYVGDAGTNATSYADGTVIPFTEYCYRVRAVNAGGKSAYSNVACATTLTGSGEALQFGNANAYAKFVNSASLNSATFTLETWFRRDGAGIGTNTGNGGIASLIPLITKGTAESENTYADINYFLGIDSATNTLCADFEEAASGAAPSQNHPVCGTTPIVNGTWYQVTATYDGTTWQLYLDGVPEASLVVGQPANAVNISPVALGTSFESNGNTTHGYFDGSLDEVRIWNYARTLAEIQGNVNAQITTPQTGLIARWSLNEDAGTTVHGTAGTTVDGTMYGTGYNWITPGAPFNIVLTSPANPSGLSVASPSAYQVNLTWMDNSNNETNFEVERGSDLAGPFSLLTTVGSNVTTLSDTNVFPTTQYCYHVRAINSVGASGYSNVSCVTTPAENASALDFGATNSYVTFGDANNLDLAQFTLEGWFRRDGTGTSDTTGAGGVGAAIPLISNGAHEADASNVDINYVLCIDDATDTLCADFEEGATGGTPGLNHPVYGVTPIANGQWYHAAVTYDGTTWRLYLNGVLENQLVVNQPVRSDNISATALATMLNSTNGTNGFFDGAMDEVRIWNYSRTEAEIRSTINTQITLPQTGLVARWGLNEGSGTTVGGTAGTIVNGTVTGTGYSWITPGAPFNVTFNAAPDVPTLIAPANASTHIALDPTLSVNVNDPESDNLTVEFYGRPKTSTAAPFTLAILPDTQVYTRVASQPLGSTIFNLQTTWIVDNQAARNIVFTDHLGDLVETGNVNSEWVVADTAFDILDSSNIPYSITPGNHDLQNGIAGFENWFGASRFASKPYYGGHYGTDNTNNYNLFSASGLDFILINLSCPSAAPSAGALTWANNLLATNSTSRGIVVCHDLLNTTAGYPFDAPGQAVYNALRGNPNLFLMLGGHLDTAGFRADTYNGNTVYSLRSDYQFQPNYGNGWLRLLEFNPATNTIQVRTYSPYLNQSMTDAGNQFSMSYSMSAPWQLIGTDNVASGGTASVNWPGLSDGTEYEWYAVAKDASHSTNSPTWSFTTDHVPQAISESYTTNEDTLLNVPAAGVLSNDTDGDNDPLTAFKNADPLNGTLTLNSNGSFDYLPNLNYCGADSFTYHAEDGIESSAVITVNLTITCVNDAPVLAAIEGTALAYTENQAATAITSTTTATDVDSANLTGATIQITTNYQNGQDVLAFTNQLGITGTWTAATGTMALTGTTTVANYQTAIRAVTYQNTSDNPSTLARTVSFTVTDGTANSNMVTRAINVTTVNDAPVLAAIEGAALAYTENQAATAITSTTTATDADSANLTGATIQITANYQNGQDVLAFTNQLGITGAWDAVTGTMALTGTTTVANYQAAIRAVTYQNTSDNPSTLARTVSFTVTDGTANSNTVTRNINVTAVNDAPVAVGESYTTAEDTALNVAAPGVLGNDTDADGNPLAAVKVTDPANGTVTLNTDGSFIYTPNANYNGIDSFTYKANDGTLDSNTVTVNITITAVNDAPVAIGESYTTAEDTVLTAALPGVLGNDTDADGNALTAIKVTDPANGTITLNSNGSFLYTPNANYNGADSFTYKANDGTVDSNTVTVNITITAVNDAPVAIGEAYTTAEDTVLIVAAPGVLTNDTDLDGNPLTAVKVANPINGTVTINTNGSFTYTPFANYNGADSFTYKANDGTLDSNIVTVNITITALNDAPVATPQSLTTPEDTALSITLGGTDVENDPLTFTVVTAPTNGSLSGTVPNIIYTPNANYNGPDSFTFKANDGNLDSAPATISINITPVNDAPVAVGESYTTAEDTALTVAAPGVLANDTDVESSPLTAIKVTDPAHGTVTLNANGSFTYTPVANYNGADSFTYKANDGILDSNTVTVSITVTPVNDAPFFTSVPMTSGAQGVPYTYDITASDPDLGAVLVITAPILPSWLTLTDNGNGTATLTGTPTNANVGIHNVTLRVSDGIANTNQIFAIDIGNVNDPPFFTSLPVVAATEDVPYTYAITTVDPDAGAILTITAPTRPAWLTLTDNGDGTATLTGTPTNANVGANNVILRVSDGIASVDQVFTVTVANVNDSPIFTSTAVTTAIEDSIYTYNITTTDPDAGAALTIIAPTLPSWLTLTDNGNGTATLSGTPLNVNVGANNVTLRVSDGIVNVDQVFVVTVANVNDPPIFTSTAVTAATEGSAYTYNIATADPDAGAALTITAPTRPAWLTLTDNGDGTATLTGTPTNANVGANTVTLRVSDGIASVDQAFTVTVANVNDPPVFTSIPVVAATEDSAYTYNIAATDPDVGAILTITAPTRPAWLTLTDNGDGTATLSGTPLNVNVGANNVTLRVSDGIVNVDQVFVVTVANVNDPPIFTSTAVTAATEGSAYTYNIATADPDVGAVLTITAPTLPSWLAFTDNGDGTGTLTGTPTIADVGIHNVTLRVSDGIVNVDQAFTVTVANVNDPPVFTSIPVVAATEDSAYTYNIAATDPDAGAVLTITAPTLPSWLALADNGDGTATLAGTPVNANVGINNIILRVSDGVANVNQAFTINVVNTNDSPTGIALSPNTVDEGQPIGTIVGVFSTTDPDDGDTFTYTFCAAPDNSLFQIAGDSLQTNAVLSTATSSALLICIHVEDSGGASFEEQFTITLNNINDPPVNTVPAAQNTPESTPLTLALSVADPDAGTNPLLIALNATNGVITLNGTNGLTFTSGDGTDDAAMIFMADNPHLNFALNGLTFKPTPGFNGLASLEIISNDQGNTGTGGPLTDTDRVDITITATPPKVLANGINTIPAHDNADLAEWEVLTQGYAQLTVSFDQDVLNAPASDIVNYINSVINPQNYLLVRDNGDGFQTISCANKVNPLDINININSVTYSNNSGGGPFVATLNINDGLPLSYGYYRLYVCGTTSITDAYGVKLAGDDILSGTDKLRNFIIREASGGGGGGGAGRGENDSDKRAGRLQIPIAIGLIPVTGFTPNQVTDLPVQSPDASYRSNDEMRLIIPSLSMNLPILGIAYKDKGWNVTWLGNNAGYLEGSAYPTWFGNTVLTGHVTDPNGKPGPFAYVKELKAGDQIRIKKNGKIYVYQVQQSLLVSPTNISAVFKHENYEWVTLVTCENYNADLGKFTMRRMVRAVLISVILEK